MKIEIKHKSTVASDKKTEELILYVCDKLKEEKTFGATVLNKVLYYIDAISYAEKGNPISNFTYVKQDHGITPHPKYFMPLKDKLLTEEIVNYHGLKQKKPIPRKTADLKVFTAEEIVHIDNVLSIFRDTNAAIASSISHDETGYKLAKHMEEIPLFTYLLTHSYPKEKDISWAKKTIKSFKSKYGKSLQRNP